MARPRKQTYTLKMYLEKINDGDIDNHADVQRRMAWSKEQINELIVTVLTDEYMPPIILGEEKNSQLLMMALFKPLWSLGNILLWSCLN